MVCPNKKIITMFSKVYFYQKAERHLFVQTRFNSQMTSHGHKRAITKSMICQALNINFSGQPKNIGAPLKCFVVLVSTFGALKALEQGNNVPRPKRF